MDAELTTQLLHRRTAQVALYKPVDLVNGEGPLLLADRPRWRELTRTVSRLGHFGGPQDPFDQGFRYPWGSSDSVQVSPPPRMPGCTYYLRSVLLTCAYVPILTGDGAQLSPNGDKVVGTRPVRKRGMWARSGHRGRPAWRALGGRRRYIPTQPAPPQLTAEKHQAVGVSRRCQRDTLPNPSFNQVLNRDA
jgi:hypothetical protein